MPKTSRTLKLIFGLIPQINIYYTASVMYNKSDIYEFSLDILTEQVKNISYLESFLFFILQIVFYTSISLFIQSYKNSGLSFCLYLKSFYSNVSREIRNEDHEALIGDDSINNILNFEVHHQPLSLIQQQKLNENKCLKIVKVTKQFGKLKAVNKVSCDLFSNEIFCLLGHNGAGKTTLVNLISGLMDPEEGDIFLDGNSILTNKDILYQNIGLCQQQDILFDFLTVAEHLQYIYDIKGIARNFNEIQDLILRLNIKDVEFRLCKDLSGGQKRKVCIALALLSGGKITILDEPTSGMDVIAKKQVWEFLKSYQKDKILLITTHSLEEAEYLGNRIGIMTDGHLVCSGTSTFLKSTYPCGININLVINSKKFSEDNKRIIYEKIKEYDPQAEIKIASKGVFTINIQQNNEHISEIFDYIEETKFENGIEDYIVGSASLEDVFLKINNKGNIKDMKYLNPSDNSENLILPEIRLNPAGFWPQLCSQLCRDLLPIFRNKTLFVLEYLGGLTCSYVFTIFLKELFLGENGGLNGIVVLSIILGFIVYLGGIVYEKIKERKTKVKYLLFLSGCNMWSYWVAFFIIDFIKLSLFNVLLLLPIYLNSDLGIYYFITLTVMSMSSLVFIYFFSSFMRDEDSGTKMLLMSVVIIAIAIAILYSFIFMPLSQKSEFFYDLFINFAYKRYVFSLFDLTPISSLGLTMYRITVADNYHRRNEHDIPVYQEYLRPIEYVYTGIMTQVINFIFYFTLMVLNETGYLAKLNKKMHSNSSNFVFSEESVAEEFYASNNFRNPLLVQNMMINQNLNANQGNVNDNQNNSNPNNNITSINDSRTQTDSSLEINTNTNQNNVNNVNNNIVNNPINQNNQNENLNNNQYQIVQTNNQYLPNNNNINARVNVNNRVNNDNPFVKEEIEKIKTQNNLSTKIEGLYKTFFPCCCGKNVRVVNNLYLGLEPNEKFGLLGFNGSGKTTTFRAITNEILFEKGKITLFGYDNQTQFDQIRPMIGYCPQENPLFDYMKVKEIISFYLDLKHSTDTIESICNTFDLYQYLDTYCKNLSGGNKRKLTFAIALMNKPNLLLLDEPSTGVDPESRRIMWKNINELSNSGHRYNMILTTHSIEEAEILCDRISWLKQGNFTCIGNPEQLKLKYSNGYKMHIKFVDTVINRNDVSTLTRQMVQDNYYAINSLVQDFNKYSNYIFANPIISLYIKVLIDVAQEIKPNTSKLKLLQIEKDFSFELEVGVLKEKQKALFSQIFNLKNNNPKIAEISINLESLGNILTLFR